MADMGCLIFHFYNFSIGSLSYIQDGSHVPYNKTSCELSKHHVRSHEMRKILENVHENQERELIITNNFI